MLVECVICYEHLQASDSIYHTPCGHVFHHPCLTRWFERSETCPECREKVPERKISRLYLNFVNDPATVDAAITSNYQTKISGLNHELLIKEIEIIESNSNNTKLSALLKSKDTEISTLQNRIWVNLEEAELYKTRIKQMANVIQDMLSKLAMRSNSVFELQRIVEEQQQELAENSEAPKIREVEANLAASEIEKLRLQRRIEELEDMVNFGVQPDNFVGRKSLQKIPLTAYNSVPFKKRKVDTSGIAGSPTPTIDVIDLTVEPLIDLTKDTVESPVSPQVLTSLHIPRAMSSLSQLSELAMHGLHPQPSL